MSRIAVGHARRDITPPAETWMMGYASREKPCEGVHDPLNANAVTLRDVEIGREYPELHIRGGIDKRILARGSDAIDEMLDHIMPAMTKRGRYIPCSDHAVPSDVSLAGYLHYRKRVMAVDASSKST